MRETVVETEHVTVRKTTLFSFVIFNNGVQLEILNSIYVIIYCTSFKKLDGRLILFRISITKGVEQQLH